jgi:hypothetical protein
VYLKKKTLPCIHPYVMAPLLQIKDYKFAWLIHLDLSLSAKSSILLFHLQCLVTVLKHSLKLITKNYIFTFCKLYIVKKWSITQYTKSLQRNISKPVILFKTLAKANSQELWVKLVNTTCLHLLSGAQCQACSKTIALAQMLCLKVVAIHPENYISDTSKAQTIA